MVKGKIINQPNLNNWSYLKRGKVALTQININKTNKNFKLNQIQPGKCKNANIGIQPPKYKKTNKADINKILLYSAKKKKSKTYTCIFNMITWN